MLVPLGATDALRTQTKVVTKGITTVFGILMGKARTKLASFRAIIGTTTLFDGGQTKTPRSI